MTEMNEMPPKKYARISDAAGEVSWQLMLYKDEPNEDLRRKATAEAIRICEALKLAHEVVATDGGATAADEQLFGQAVKRRLIEGRPQVAPVVTRVIELLPEICKTLSMDRLTAEEAQFLQSEFAALSLILQDRGL